MAFEAGAVVGRMVLDRSGWDDGVRKVQSDIQQFGQRVTSLGQSFTSVGRNLGMLSRNLIFFGAGILTPLIATFKSMQNYSYGVNWEITRLSRNFLEFRRSIAESMLPTIRQFNQIFADFVRWWKELPEALRNSIIQTALISGAILVLVGTFGTGVANLIKLLGAGFKLFGTLLTTSIVSPVALITASILGVIYAMWQWEDVSNAVVNSIELSFKSLENGILVIKLAFQELVKGVWEGMRKLTAKNLFDQEGITKALNLLEKIPEKVRRLSPLLSGLEVYYKTVQALGDIPSFGEDISNKMNAGIQDTINRISELNEEIQALGQNMLSGKAGDWASALNKKKEELKKTIDDVISYFKNKQNSVSDSITSAWTEFANGLGVALTNAYTDLTNWGLMAKNIIGSFVGSMSSMFSDFFYNVFTGQLKDAQAVFAEFGRSLLRIISDVISQLIVAWIIKSMITPVPYEAIGQGILGTISGAFGGFQTGIERVPHTGVYKLEEGEQVVPRYDATKKDREPMQIMNFITPEAVAMAMADKAGANVIMNIINVNSLRNGIYRTEIQRR
jgi:phage FluMu protein gp41